MAEIANGAQIDKNSNEKHNPKTTRFPITKKIAGTYRFGEIGPCLVFNGIEGDRVRVRQTGEVDSYTLKAPLMENIYLNKSYFQVPRMAILPKNWDKIHVQPAIGDDIDATLEGTSVPSNIFTQYIGKIYSAIREATQELNISDNLNELYDAAEKLIYAINLGEPIFSRGGMCSIMGANFWPLWKTFDEIVELFYNPGIAVKGLSVKDRDTNDRYYVILPKSEFNAASVGNAARPIITIHEFQVKVRDGNRYQIEGFVDNNLTPITNTETINGAYSELVETRLYPNTSPTYTKPFDLARFWAYQLVCAEYFTNDKVDYIYNVELYRQYIKNLFINYMGGGDTLYYTWNGIQIESDELSARYFKFFTEELEIVARINEEQYEYFVSIFKINRSLKYKDYFTGSKTRPLAVGDEKVNTSVPIVDGKVDVVNITKGIQAQRFLNIVNRIPRDAFGYARGIMGVTQEPDYHRPLHLAETTEAIFGNEVENTASEQFSKDVSRTMTLKNGSGKYEYSFTLDRDSIIIGVYWFDIERMYTKGVNRTFMHVDRHDMFNPYLQYTGDQAIYSEEMNSSKAGTNFGYKEAYAEFKEEVNTAFGGFLGALDGWAFTDEEVDSKTADQVQELRQISPDFIRSNPAELDKFYLSLTGVSLVTYFHFIILTSTFFETRRKMAYKPQILG